MIKIKTQHDSTFPHLYWRVTANDAIWIFGDHQSTVQKVMQSLNFQKAEAEANQPS